MLVWYANALARNLKSYLELIACTMWICQLCIETKQTRIILAVNVWETIEHYHNHNEM